MSNIDNIPSLITVRSTSTRLPGKCFLPFGQVSVLEHVVLRAKHYGLSPIICTTRDPEDDQIVELAQNIGIPHYRGPTQNKLLRWNECCKFFELSAFHSVDADDPFFCAEEVKRSFALLRTGYDMVSPTPSSSAGGATVGYSLTAEVIANACDGLEENTDTEMMWSFVGLVSGLKNIVLTDPDDHVIRARMTLDYWEDYIMLEAVRLIVGNLGSRADIARLLKSNPDLEKCNAFRTAEWTQTQQSKSLKTGNLL